MHILHTVIDIASFLSLRTPHCPREPGTPCVSSRPLSSIDCGSHGMCTRTAGQVPVRPSVTARGRVASLHRDSQQCRPVSRFSRWQVNTMIEPTRHGTNQNFMLRAHNDGNIKYAQSCTAFSTFTHRFSGSIAAETHHRPALAPLSRSQNSRVL